MSTAGVDSPLTSAGTGSVRRCLRRSIRGGHPRYCARAGARAGAVAGVGTAVGPGLVDEDRHLRAVLEAELVAEWLDLSRATEPLLAGSMAGQNWAQLGTASLVWLGVPLAVGTWRVMTMEVA
ncbi:MAG: hypothetical protein ACRCSN_17005 [Dermatophilaceae bacterium]